MQFVAANAVSRFVHAVAVGFAMMCIAENSVAASIEYPTKPLRLVIPYTPGGPTDFVGRAIAVKLQEAVGQQVIVDNRAGGGGVIATELVARAAPDGYTLLLGTPGQLVTLPLLMAKLPYDALKDFSPVTQVVASPQVLVATTKLPVSHGERTHCVCKDTSRTVELCVCCHRRHRSSRHGTAQAGQRNRNAACAV